MTDTTPSQSGFTATGETQAVEQKQAHARHLNEIRTGIQVRMGLVGDPHLRRLLRAHLELPAKMGGQRRTDDDEWLLDIGHHLLKVTRIVSAAAGSILDDADNPEQMPNKREILITASLFATPKGATQSTADIVRAHHEAAKAYTNAQHGLDRLDEGVNIINQTIRQAAYGHDWDTEESIILRHAQHMVLEIEGHQRLIPGVLEESVDSISGSDTAPAE